ncbi:MAG: hypothetical protein GY765_15245 [bacterium]|nr:hypothetical protein [bacterium]
MYEQKSSAPGSYLPKVKEEYGNTFLETVKDWGAANIPPRTLGKLKDLSAKILKNVGDKSMVVIFKLIEEYLKSQVI